MPPLPDRIAGLASIARNLSWAWHRDTRALFSALDRRLWEETRHNPIELLARIDPARLEACADDPGFLDRYDALARWSTDHASGQDTWYAAAFPDLGDRPIAYFCAEFGLHRSVPVYSGGLGVLAGDHCKACSDLGVPLVGVGLLYLRGYFDQRLRPDGWQEDADATFNLAATPLERVPGPEGRDYLAMVRAGGRDVHVAAWRLLVGRVPVYLLDTDLERNDPADRALTSRLYAGGPAMRLLQEWVLGLGGVRVLRALGVEPAAWHANEGHAAFMMVERVRELVTRGASFSDAVRAVRAAGVFTTHTPVPAGHDVFTVDQIQQTIGTVWEDMGVDRDAFLSMGRRPAHEPGGFHMTVAALRLARQVNAVSQPHGEVSRRLWADLWPGRPPERVPIGHITNGVHRDTWMAPSIARLLDRRFGPNWSRHAETPEFWDSVVVLDDAELWAAHVHLKALLMSFMREEARGRFVDHWRDAPQVVGAGTLLDPDALTIGFGRRFATYKRAALPFRDRERLRRLLTNQRRPVQIIFAGKAHPEDVPGKELLRQVYAFTRDPQFEGRVAFLEDYDLHLARRLMQGVDLWLNLPRLPLEASGTSGMKAALNAVPQLGTLDGWWVEGYAETNGWAIPAAPAGTDPDAADAEALYRLLEEAVVPLFYARDARGLPVGWIGTMKQALRVAGARFTASLMVREYVKQCYAPAIRGGGGGGGGSDSTGGSDDPPVA